MDVHSQYHILASLTTGSNCPGKQQIRGRVGTEIDVEVLIRRTKPDPVWN